MATTRKSYSQEFKKQAVEWSLLQSTTLQEQALELETSVKNLMNWRKAYQEDRLEKGKQSKSVEQAEISKLKKELQMVKMERDILKKAMGIFAGKKS